MVQAPSSNTRQVKSPRHKGCLLYVLFVLFLTSGELLFTLGESINISVLFFSFSVMSLILLCLVVFDDFLFVVMLFECSLSLLGNSYFLG